MKIYTTYLDIFKTLTDFCDKLKQEEHSLELLKTSATQKKSDIDKSLDEKLDDIDINTKKKTLDTMLNISGSYVYTKEIQSTAIPRPYDITKLRTLQASNDYKALYTEAAGQLEYIKELELDIRHKAEKEKQQIENELHKKQAEFLHRCNDLKKQVITFLKSDTYTEFIYFAKEEMKAFDFTRLDESFSRNRIFNIGKMALPFPAVPEFEDELVSLSDGLFDKQTHSILIPCDMDMPGRVLLAEYNNSTEDDLLQGIRAILLNIARYYRESYDQVVFIDPIRSNNSGLGCLSPLSEGKNSFINHVPSSKDEIKRLLKSIIDTLNDEEHDINKKEQQTKRHRIYVFHDFPKEYDGELVSRIQQLCATAEHYGITVILTNNIDSRNTSGYDVLNYIKSKAQHIKLNENGENVIYRKDIDSPVKFKWFKAPSSLPEDVYQAFITNRPQVDIHNHYEKHFDLSQIPKYSKGKREITYIPYGIDEDGKVRDLNFENTNFATFICGASRSGKSNLLHIIITGIVKNNHPDDVEVWLVDFKMTEFSRYITNFPPHVKYILLDESPELVYDIIDKLTDILTKRQNRFKRRKWAKLSDVPTETYMPSIFVIIDEFSIMSQIVADSVTMGKYNYTTRLQNLLAKGAALGMHFIFASQGFSVGTRGLNDFSKNQIQQRIAMKTTVDDIKATLNLRSEGEDDRARMEQLPEYHALVKSRVPDTRGNYLIYSKVLRIDDDDIQKKFIKKISSSLTPISKYDPTNINCYKDKKALIIDGDKYATFESRQIEMNECLCDFENYEDKLLLFTGEPRRIMAVYPLRFEKALRENLLVIGSIEEKISMSSVLISILKSLKMQDIPTTIFTSTQNSIYRYTKQSRDVRNSQVIEDVELICKKIKDLKEKIELRISDDRFYIILGLDDIYDDILFSVGNTRKASVTMYATRAPGEPDLDTLVSLANKGEDVELPTDDTSSISADDNDNSSIYDVREDLKYILEYGPKLGYHFILFNNSVAEYNQTQLNFTLFKHRIFFRMPRIDASGIVGSQNASIIADLPDHTFRYTNGQDSLSFRPYLHKGIAIDGWQVTKDGTVILEEEED